MYELLRLLENDATKRILVATYGCPRSASELSFRIGVPLVRCYKLLKELELRGLVTSHVCFLANGRVRRLYKARLENARVVMDGDRLLMQFDLLDERMGCSRAFEILN